MFPKNCGLFADADLLFGQAHAASKDGAHGPEKWEPVFGQVHAASKEGNLMFQFLDRLGLPAKYAMLYAVAVVAVLFLWSTFGEGSGEPMVYAIGVGMAVVYGAGKGWLRSKRGFRS